MRLPFHSFLRALIFAGLGSSPDLLKTARDTFRFRNNPNACGWSQCAVQGARLGTEDAWDVLVDHYKGNGTQWEYGGWNSPAGMLYKGSYLRSCPFFDSAGVNMTGLQELLMPSHAIEPNANLYEGGLIRILPAAPKELAGRFRLHARGGFIVTAEFADGKATRVDIEATRSGTLRLINPFDRTTVSHSGSAAVTIDTLQIETAAKAGERFLFRPAP